MSWKWRGSSSRRHVGVRYPPAVARGFGAGLTKGVDPVGWRADVAYVPSHDNRSHGSVLQGCTGRPERWDPPSELIAGWMRPLNRGMPTDHNIGSY